jgi:predicted  nucleic acid-binding Zn-ribbon protein
VATELETLIHLQGFDTRIAALDAEAARLPRQIEALQAALADAQKSLETLKARVEATRKDLRGRERDLDDVGVKRSKSESRLYEVKTNDEYSAVLREIEEIKRTKAKIEEDILNLMEGQERLAADMQEAEGRLRAREEQSRKDEGVVREKLAVVQKELEGVRAERATLARELPTGLLSSYERTLKARGGLAIAGASSPAFICGGCRVTIRPQAIQELRAATQLMLCESCGRYLYWQEQTDAARA